MSTRDLINAIAAGDALEIENAFNSVMAEKVSARIDDMRIDVAQNLFSEDSEELDEEQLDEISKKTLGSYVKKASFDAAAHNGEVQNIRGQEGDSMYDDDETEHHEKKFQKRMKGINKAVDRMSEDFEQLDELSKDTLKSYVDKRTDKSDFNHPYDPPESDDGHSADYQRKLTRKSDKADEKATAAKKAGDTKGYHKNMSKMYKHAADFNNDIEGYDVGTKHATGLSRAHARLSKSK